MYEESETIPQDNVTNRANRFAASSEIPGQCNLLAPFQSQEIFFMYVRIHVCIRNMSGHI